MKETFETDQQTIILSEGDSPQRFTQNLIAKGLPESWRDNANDFATKLLVHNPPEGILDRLAQAFVYLSNKHIEGYLDTMAERAKGVIGDKDYYLALFSSDPEKSNVYIFNQMIKRGIPLPKKNFSSSATEFPAITIDGMDGTFPVVDKDEMQNLPTNANLLSFDDWSLSGAQARHALSYTVPSSINVYTFVMCATQHAIDEVHKPKNPFTENPYNHVEIAREELIPNLQTTLHTADRDFFTNLIRKKRGAGNFDHYRGVRTLMGSAYKIPDNTHNIFWRGIKDVQGQLILPPLISRVNPPYKTK